MSRRSVLGAFRASNDAFAAIRRIPLQQRTFTSTAQCSAPTITTFTPTSSPELDELLEEIRMKIILPSFLRPEQREKLGKKKYAAALQSDPIIMEIDGKILRFRHVPMDKLPDTQKIVTRVINSFKTADDFKNLLPLLEGLHQSRRKLEPWFFAKLIRLTCWRSNAYDVIELARRVDTTNLKLDTSEKVNELLNAVQMKAVDAGWTTAATEQALTWTRLVIDLLEDERHQPTFGTKCRIKWVEGQPPLRRDPQVLLAQLHMVAALVVKCKAGEQMVDEVAKLAKRIMLLWPEGKGIRDIHPPKAYERRDNMGYFLEPNKFLTLAAPLLHGLQMATEVVKDPEVWHQLQVKRDIVYEEVQQAKDQAQQLGLEGKAVRGIAVYNKLFNGE